LTVGEAEGQKIVDCRLPNLLLNYLLAEMSILYFLGKVVHRPLVVGWESSSNCQIEKARLNW